MSKIDQDILKAEEWIRECKTKNCDKIRGLSLSPKWKDIPRIFRFFLPNKVSYALGEHQGYVLAHEILKEIIEKNNLRSK